MGVTLEYARQGPATGTPLIFLHGVTDSWRSFEDVMALLPPELSVIAISQRGHGNSSRPPAGYRYTDMAADLAAFLDALSIPSAVVAGHSMGAMVALEFAAAYPSRAAALVVMAGWPTLRGDAAIRAFYDESIKPLSDPVPAVFAQEFQESTLARPISPEKLRKFVAESQKVPAYVWKAAFEGFVTTDPADLRRITAPVQLVWGDLDAYAQRKEQEALLAAIPQARLTIHNGAGHALHWEDPSQFVRDLLVFLQQAAGGKFRGRNRSNAPAIPADQKACLGLESSWGRDAL